MTLDGIKNMGSLPDALFVIDVDHEDIAVREAKRLGITVIGIVDTNSSPDNIDYLVPGNDDATRAIRFYCQAIADTIVEARGTVEPEQAAEQNEKVTPIIKKRVVAKRAVVTDSAAESTDAASAEETATPESSKTSGSPDAAKKPRAAKPDSDDGSTADHLAESKKAARK